MTDPNIPKFNFKQEELDDLRSKLEQVRRGEVSGIELERAINQYRTALTVNSLDASIELAKIQVEYDEIRQHTA